MRHRKLPWIAFTALFAALACTVPKVYAQLAVTTATLSGTVTDSTGAVVPQANVKLSSPEKGIVRDYVTDASGRVPDAATPGYVLPFDSGRGL